MLRPNVLFEVNDEEQDSVCAHLTQRDFNHSPPVNLVSIHIAPGHQSSRLSN